MPLRVALGITRQVCCKRSLFSIVVASYGAIQLGSIRLVIVSTILVTIRIDVRVAFRLERREHGLGEGGG